MRTTSAFHIERMDCASEEQIVRIQLGQRDDVEAVNVDLDERLVVVTHSSEPSTIKTALDELDLHTTRIDDPDMVPDSIPNKPSRERRILGTALAINAVFFVGELAAGVVSRSMGLVADSIDMLADASVYALSLLAVGTSALHKKRLAAASGYLQFGLALIGLIEVTRRFLASDPAPDARTMIIVSFLALAANTATLVILRRARSPEAHFQASWIFTANDLKANTLVIVSAVVVIITGSTIADLIAGAVIFVIVANGARRILALAH